jgi:hypothetical protein
MIYIPVFITSTGIIYSFNRSIKHSLHKGVAIQLKASNGSVQKAIKQLILNGKVKEQKDGVLYDLVPSES